MTFSNNSLSSEEWQKLLAEYRSTIPQKINELKQKIEAVQKSPTEETFKALRFVVHKLAGNAGIYGFAKVSVICKKLELEILEKIDQVPHSSPDQKWLLNLSDHLAQIEKAFYGKD